MGQHWEPEDDGRWLRRVRIWNIRHNFIGTYSFWFVTATLVGWFIYG